eukprot:1138013-Pelagomonas_calceolata.AAC.1
MLLHQKVSLQNNGVKRPDGWPDKRPMKDDTAEKSRVHQDKKVLSASKIPMQDLIGDLRYRQQKIWREADALSPREAIRKAATYHHWCGDL